MFFNGVDEQFLRAYEDIHSYTIQAVPVNHVRHPLLADGEASLAFRKELVKNPSYLRECLSRRQARGV